MNHRPRCDLALRHANGVGNRVFFFNDTATTEIYTLSLHDALPISEAFEAPDCELRPDVDWELRCLLMAPPVDVRVGRDDSRSEEHTSELQSCQYLVCRLLLEKKNSSFLILSLLHSTSPPTSPGSLS